MTKVKVAAAEYSGIDRKKYVTGMFDSIADNYDFLNHFLSGGIDILWRKRAAKRLKLTEESVHLDIATGTGDFAFEIENRYKCAVHGLDISKEMLKVAETKKQKRNKSNIFFTLGDGEKLPYEANYFDSVTIAFGIRNFGNREQALEEIHRVLKQDGQLSILEFAKNRTFVIGRLFEFYFKHILPKVGAMFSKDKEAYTYLPESVNSFMTQQDFTAMLKDQFRVASFRNFTFGICTLFEARK
jgi:demethylmenaquinone methyltransferase/2-methoxy-6-polyprenyl-1,4-benzoquinol methylase